MSRPRYIISRSLQTVFLIWFILTFLFFFFRLMPGSTIDLMAYQGALSEEARAALIDRFGLDQPIYVQYYKYLFNLLQLDAGTSFRYNEPVISVVAWRIINSLILVAPGITLGYIIGTLLGIVSGNRRGSIFEQSTIFSVLVLGTIPSFFLGIVVIALFSQWFGLFPFEGLVSLETQRALSEAPYWRRYLTFDFIYHFVLPFTTVALTQVMNPTLIMRTSVVEILGQDFIKYHRSNGLPRSRVYRHVGKHATLPVITMYPISLARAFSGLVLIEVVFNWPGIGFSLFQAILFRDYPIIMFVFFLVAAFIVIGNFVVDIVYGIIDPRVSVGD